MRNQNYGGSLGGLGGPRSPPGDHDQGALGRGEGLQGMGRPGEGLPPPPLLALMASPGNPLNMGLRGLGGSAFY